MILLVNDAEDVGRVQISWVLDALAELQRNIERNINAGLSMREGNWVSFGDRMRQIEVARKVVALLAWMKFIQTVVTEIVREDSKSGPLGQGKSDARCSSG